MFPSTLFHLLHTDMEDEAEDCLMLKRALRYFFGGAVSAVLATVGMLLWQRGPWYDRSPDFKVWYGYDATSLVGLMLVCTFSALAVVLLNVASTTYLRYAVGYCDRKAAIVTAFVIHCMLAMCYFTTGFVAAVLWARDPLKCGVIFCYGEPYIESNTVTSAAKAVNAGFGMMALFTLCPLALVMWGRAIVSWLQIREVWDEARTPGANRLQGRSVEDGAWGFTTRIRLFHVPRMCRQLVMVISLLIALCFFATVSFYLPNGNTEYIASLIALCAAGRPSRTVNGGNYTVPELPHAVFRTHEIRVADGLYLKIFPSNAFFYGYLMVLLVLIWALQLTQGGRYWMSRRMVLCPAWSLSEGVVLLLTVVMCVLFFFYWVHDHNFKHTWGEGQPVKGYMGTAEIWGRALGQLALLFLSLLMFPISRRSVLFTLLGMSWDSFMWFHRTMGYAMLLATLGHMIASKAFQNQDVLLHNLNKLPTIVGQNNIVFDFTVNVVAWATWLTLVSMGLLALHWVRRHYFELFYYSHLVAAYALFPAVLWHAAAGWEYMLPGLTLWFVDRLIRLFQSSALVTVRHAYAVSEDVVEIAFTVGMWGCNSVHPGHYVFVNVPEISPLQWHPMTLSSAVPVKKDACGGGTSSDAYLLASSTAGQGLVGNEDSNVLTVHVKSMGRGTWSGRLYRHVTLGRPLTLCVDGPCGTPIDFSLYDDIYFVCGGIGVTPCASIFGSLVREQLLAAEYGVCRPRRVRLVWVTRSAALMGAMAGTLCLPAHLKQLAHSPTTQGQPGHRNPAKNDASQTDRKGVNHRNYLSCAPKEDTSVDQGYRDECAVYLGGSSHFSLNGAGRMASTLQQYFECHVYITNKQSYREYQTCEKSFYRGNAKLYLSRREGVELGETEVDAYAAPSAGVATGDGLVALRVASGRPCLADEVNPGLISNTRVPELPFNVQRAIVFVCGPETLVDEMERICAEQKLAIHKEYFFL